MIINKHFSFFEGKAELEIKRLSSERVAIIVDAIQESYNTGKIVHLSQTK